MRRIAGVLGHPKHEMTGNDAHGGIDEWGQQGIESTRREGLSRISQHDDIPLSGTHEFIQDGGFPATRRERMQSDPRICQVRHDRCGIVGRTVRTDEDLFHKRAAVEHAGNLRSKAWCLVVHADQDGHAPGEWAAQDGPRRQSGQNEHVQRIAEIRIEEHRQRGGDDHVGSAHPRLI